MAAWPHRDRSGQDGRAPWGPGWCCRGTVGHWCRQERVEVCSHELVADRGLEGAVEVVVLAGEVPGLVLVGLVQVAVGLAVAVTVLLYELEPAIVVEVAVRGVEPAVVVGVDLVQVE